mmetsp:Transcript_5040/g.12664  ORF Transcript_5040/g.12664 Transcript_5040/m.12664 type:complete len:152 (+) Transcript_5040:1-456(+)
MPVVSSDACAEGTFRVAIVEGEALSLDRAVSAVSCAESGAVATFQGVVRDNSDGRGTDHLEYEAYAPMAVKVMRGICEFLTKRRGVSKVFMAHRVGRLEVGECAVVIAVSAPHRADAINVSREAIDELKLKVPIFKKEVFHDGQVWKSNRP